MILVDTSAWIEFLRATGSSADRRLTEMVGREPYAITDVVMAELAAGARDDADATRIRGIADTAVFYPVRPLFDYETAADLYRRVRRTGAIPRSLADCLVAAIAMNNDLDLLAVNRDLDVIAGVCGLRVVS